MGTLRNYFKSLESFHLPPSPPPGEALRGFSQPTPTNGMGSKINKTLTKLCTQTKFTASGHMLQIKLKHFYQLNLPVWVTLVFSSEHRQQKTEEERHRGKTADCHNYKNKEEKFIIQ